jgi:hypothetical protein
LTDLNPKPISSETSFDGGYPTSARLVLSSNVQQSILSVTSFFILQAIAYQMAGRPISAIVSAVNREVRPRQKAQA